MSKNESHSRSEDKSEENFSTQTGRIWSCNQELSNLTGAQSELDWELSDELKKLETDCKCEFYKGDYFSVYFISIEDVKKYSATHIFNLFAKYLFEHFGFSEQLSL
jgi:hypothetical protein